MTATATDARADLLALIADKEMDAAEVASVCGVPALAAAFAAGDLEFGRRRYTVTGHNRKPTMVIEDATSWTGPKTRLHKPAREILAEPCPAADGGYARYVRNTAVAVNPGEPQPLRLDDVSRPDGEALLALRVRLTDQGLGKLA